MYFYTTHYKHFFVQIRNFIQTNVKNFFFVHLLPAIVTVTKSS